VSQATDLHTDVDAAIVSLDTLGASIRQLS
jgi:hypothetical protein